MLQPLTITNLPPEEENTMKNTVFVTLAAALLIPGSAFASATLAQANNCMSCHAPDKKLVGPSYQDIARKYAGQKDVEAKLAAAMKNGSKGVWGELAMPPNANLKEEDAKTLAKWVLSGAK